MFSTLVSVNTVTQIEGTKQMLKIKLKPALVGCLFMVVPLTACGEINFTPVNTSVTTAAATTAVATSAAPTITAAPTVTAAFVATVTPLPPTVIPVVTSLPTFTAVPATTATAAPTATVVPTVAPTASKPTAIPTSAAKGKVMPVFQPILASVKRQTQLPLLLPTYLPENTGPKLYASSEKGEDGYYIELSFAPDCHGDTACHLGGIEGHAATTNGQNGTKVKLAQNLTGYFVDANCGASCGDSTLSWRQNSVTYTVSIKAGKQADLLKMANSAILNGLIK